jgi:hypothetical protein
MTWEVSHSIWKTEIGMSFRLVLTSRAKSDLETLSSNPAFSKQLKAARGCLAKLESNPRHPGLRTHKFSDLSGLGDEVVFEAYAENNTPGTYRIFWHYGPDKDVITIVAITAHP